MDEKLNIDGSQKAFNPNGVGLRNGHFIGLPFKEEDARVVVISIPWDVTVSYGAGTADGPDSILTASCQLDLEDEAIPNAWQIGLFVKPPSKTIRTASADLRSLAEPYINLLEEGTDPELISDQIIPINLSCQELHESVYHEAKRLLGSGKIPGLLGGDHSTPYGLIKALLERYPDLGILQIDAHMDLRQAYEGFEWSHASIFYNVMHRLPVKKLVQVGIRDFCKEEVDFAHHHQDRISFHTDRALRRSLFKGSSFGEICKKIIAPLPMEVYISFDIDGLDPSLCPGTGTPVPGGLSIQEAFYILELVKESGRKIIGFDLCEVAGNNNWDANVGARVLYKLANLAGSQ
ncbi:MAG: agmatinase family protein [Saprospiraceae bacterium]|nr:agmatinase family protein [Saprospiraceae bacterium]